MTTLAIDVTNGRTTIVLDGVMMNKCSGMTLTMTPGEAPYAELGFWAHEALQLVIDDANVLAYLRDAPGGPGATHIHEVLDRMVPVDVQRAIYTFLQDRFEDGFLKPEENAP